MNLDDFTKCDRCGKGYTPKGAPAELPCPSLDCMPSGARYYRTVSFPEVNTVTFAHEEAPETVVHVIERMWERLPLASGSHRIGYGWREVAR